MSFEHFGRSSPTESHALTDSSTKRPKIQSSADKKIIFFTVNRQKCRLISAVKKFQDILNVAISADLHRLLAPE